MKLAFLQQKFVNGWAKAKNVTYNRFNDMYYLCYTTTEAQIKLFHYFYDNITYPCLTRKQNKMREALDL